MKNTYQVFGAALMSLAFATTYTHAAEITWQAPVAMSADTDISVNGELRVAINAAGAAVTFNAGTTDEVIFLGIGSPTVTDSAMGTATFETEINNAAGPDTFQTGTLGGTNIGDLIGGAFWHNITQPAISTFSDLVVGQEYEIQIFSSDARDRDNTFTTMWSNGLDPADQNYVQFSALVPINNMPNGDAQGSFVIGTFTADATTQSFEGYGSTDSGVTANSAGRLQINAIQLRAIGTILPIPVAVENIWSGLVNANLDNSTTNFAQNFPDDPLDQGSLATAVSNMANVIFADTYPDNGVDLAVAVSDLSIPLNGAPTAPEFLFRNTVGTPYTVTSLDTTGITGAMTDVVTEDPDPLVDGDGGTLTLFGIHSFEGRLAAAGDTTINIGDASNLGSVENADITANGLVTIDTTANDATLNGEFSGVGTFEKLGPNTLTLTGSSGGFGTGTTLVTEGTLTVTGPYTGSTVNIASGAAFEIDRSAEVGGNIAFTGTYTGDGTMRIINDNLFSNAFIQIRGTMALGPDANLEIVSTGDNTAPHRGSGAFRANWVDNQSNMNIAAGASFRGVEGRVRVNALTGDGDLTTGWTDDAYLAEGFTVGVAGGSGTFNGGIGDNDLFQNQLGIIRKVGAGTQTLTGTNTYTGDTIVEEGSLVFTQSQAADAAASTIRFAPTINQESNQALGGGLGTGSLTLDGILELELSNADLTMGNFWVLVDDSNLAVTYGPDFSVETSTFDQFTENTPGVWTATLTDGTILNFDESSGTLFVGPVFNTPPPGSGIILVSAGFNGTSYDIEFSNLDNSATYQLRRSTDLQDGFPVDVGVSFTGGVTNIFSDLNPLSGKGFYQLFEVTAP